MSPGDRGRLDARGTGLAALAMAILFNMRPSFTPLPLLVLAERLTQRRWLGTGAAFVGVALLLRERGTLDSLQKIGRTFGACR